MKDKRFSEMQDIGEAKYVVNFHDGVKAHDDGSDFMDVRIFKSKALKDRFVRGLLARGYREDA